MKKTSLRNALVLTASAVALLSATQAFAADAAAAPTPTMTGAGAEGTDVSTIIVTAERNKAAAEAPSKASLEQTQPEAIISRKFIEQVTPEVGDYTTAAAIAPSMSGITTNGGGIGDYNKSSLRGFQDGQYNLTYDGISFGDTNDPTHHPADYWPASTIGAVVVDRGPGAAGDLGQANFGGAIHMFSPEVTDKFGVMQKVTYGSYNTVDLVTTLNTGTLSQLAGGKLLLSFNERQSDGELSHSGGNMANQLAKFILPVGDKATFTLFGAREYTRFNLADAGPGETLAQVQAYGKNFALNNIPTDEHYYKYNYEAKATDFEYADLKGELFPSLTAENQLYTYFYANKTTSVNDISGLVGGANTSPPNITKAPQSATDIGGYDKLNEYRVWGDVVRVNKEWSFGTLKMGGIVETSSTNRHNLFEDLTLGIPDNKFKPGPSLPTLTAPTNAKLQEDSKWLQYQLFADFDWKVTDALTVSPGFKYVDFDRTVNAANESTAGGSKNQPLHATNTYTQPLYFVTANYKIRSDWAVYGQVATSFLIPSLSDLYTTEASIQSLQPEKTTSYQAGTVFTHGDITADADVYRVDATNLILGCKILDAVTHVPTAANCNFGTARYTGVEGEAAYHFDFGLTVFVNGSLNSAKQLATAANTVVSTPNTAGELPNAPKWTDAAGVIYSRGPIQGSVTYKQSGAYISSDGPRMSGYDTIDASGTYDFGHYAVKLQVFNIADKRAVTALSGGLYSFQAGREVLATLSAKF